MTERQIVKRVRNSARPMLEVGEIADELCTNAIEIIHVLAENGVKFPFDKSKGNETYDITG